MPSCLDRALNCSGKFKSATMLRRLSRHLHSAIQPGGQLNMSAPSPALFFDTISAYQRTEALRAAIELDLFSLMAAGSNTATQLADACQAAPRGVRILADFLTILGFLTKHGDRYELTSDAKTFLDRQ